MSARFSAMRPAQLAALALVLTAASAQGQSAWAYADVYYDAATDRVIATTTTLVDYSTEYYYSPKVQVSLSGSDGSYAWWYCPYGGAGACTNGNYAYGDVFVSAAPGVTYTVQGFHSVETYYYYYDMDPGCTWGCYNWYDALGYSTGSCSPACQADPNCFCVEVLGVPYNRSYLAPWILHLVYVASQPLGDTSKQATTQQALLSCTPSAVTRGSNVNCTVSGPGSTRVTDWSFTGGGGNVSGPPSVTWGGPMVQSGTISAKAGGLPTQPASFNITVNPRSGWAFAAANAEQQPNNFRIPEGTILSIPSPPTQSGDAVGLYTLVQHFTFDAVEVPYNQNGKGPNTGYKYISVVSNSETALIDGNPVNLATRYHWVMSPDLVAATSDFYKAQCGTYNLQTGTGFISPQNLQANTIRHESHPATQSHYVFYKSAQEFHQLNLGTNAEELVDLPSTSLAAFIGYVTNVLNGLVAAIYQATNIEPFSVNHNDVGVFQGPIQFYPYSVTCQ